MLLFLLHTEKFDPPKYGLILPEFFPSTDTLCTTVCFDNYDKNSIFFLKRLVLEGNY